MPKVIKDIVEKIFDRNMSVDLYKSQYDPEMLEKQQKKLKQIIEDLIYLIKEKLKKQLNI